jgi:hypothetical protein
VVNRIPDLRKWVLRFSMLVLVLAAYGGTAVGNRNLIRVAEATESEGETFVYHEIAETRRESSAPKRRRERRHGEIDEHHAQPDFRCHGRLWFINEHFKVREAFGRSSPPRAPPVLS